MHQRWENLLFLHWIASLSDLQRTLPQKYIDELMNLLGQRKIKLKI
jgi:hypothetical protein